MTINIKEQYNKFAVPGMMKEFELKNAMAVPKLLKVTLNVGISSGKKDDNYMKLVESTLKRISGQKPIFTKSKKAISAFKIRENQVVGCKVTLRKTRMYDFLTKFVNIVLPRVRDFRGLNTKSIDKTGNLTIGFKEHLVFGEVDNDEVENIHGLEVVITTNAGNKQKGLALFKLLNFPFEK